MARVSSARDPPRATPLAGAASRGYPALFRFDLVTPHTALQLRLTSFAGDPDLCLTRNASALSLVPHALGDPSYEPLAADAAFVARLEQACAWRGVGWGLGGAWQGQGGPPTPPPPAPPPP